MIRWITYAACALVFGLLLAPARRSAESSSNKSYTSDDVLTRSFPFTAEGPEANDIHIKWRQKIRVAKATGDNPPDINWNVDRGNNTAEMTLSVAKGGKNLHAAGDLVLELEPLDDNSKTEFWDLVESYQWTLDGKTKYKDSEGKEHEFKVHKADDKVGSAGSSGAVGAAKVATAGGLRTVTFDTPPGQIRVYLPDDMRAGDTISGTVIAEPKGQTPEERAKNMLPMGDRKINIATAKKPDGTSDVNVEVRVAATPSPFTFTLPPGNAPTPPLKSVSGANSSGLGITLTNTTGSFTIGGTTTVPIEMISLSLQSVAPLKIFQLPTIGQQGKLIEVFGPFNGNSSQASLNWTAVRSAVQDFEKNTEDVSGGFGLIDGQPIAESPRKAIFECPTKVTGQMEITLNEGNTKTTGTYRNLGINLTAPKTSLLKGESTELHVEVNGLQGLTQPVPLTLESHGVITMVGGNYQPLVIQPSQVGADGRYSTTRGITGVQTGGWTATGTVVTHRFDFCLQDDSNPRTVVLVNSFTGDYIFTPSGGTSLSGTGTVTRKGCTITLTDSPADRRVQSTIDPCTQTGSASIQISPPNKPKIKFTIIDRNTTNNTCAVQ